MVCCCKHFTENDLFIQLQEQNVFKKNVQKQSISFRKGIDENVNNRFNSFISIPGPKAISFHLRRSRLNVQLISCKMRREALEVKKLEVCHDLIV